MQIKKPTQQEYKSAVNMLNRVFGKNFPKLLPKLYAKDKDFAANHFVVVENEEVIGAIASIPLEYHIGEEIMPVRGIGMVGTKKSARGRGVMSKMLDSIYQEALDNGAVAMCLGGNLDRYNRHGFFPSGKEYEFTIRKKREYIDKCEEWSFEKLKENDPNINLLQQMHDEQTSYWKRDDFYKTLVNWKNIPYIIKHNGQAVGYLIKQKFLPFVLEIVISEEDIVPCMTAWIKRARVDRVRVNINPYRQDLVDIMLQNCETYHTNSSESWSILDWQRAIEIMLRYKTKSQGVRDGQIVVDIAGEILDISVEGQNVTVTPTKAQPQISLDRNTATKMFFGLDGMYKSHTILDEWLPMSICMQSADKV